MSFGMRLVIDFAHRLIVTMPEIQWSLLQAYQRGIIGPPSYVEPTFEEEEFSPRLKLMQRRIEGFESLTHVERMQLVDEANEAFRFAYTRGIDEDDDRKKGYFKIPLMRDRNITEAYDGIDRIKKRISRVEYERATAMLESVGEMERIARAIPYYDLYRTVTKHLRGAHKVGLDEIVLVSVDRGGRLPCLILQRALGLHEMYSLKVDQGGGRLDLDKLEEFARQGTFKGKHILFVDSTVDSGRQIMVLKKHLDSDEWRTRLGYKSWSIVGSNEWNESLERHCNVNWGVNPDDTFEDNADLMGIDYHPDSNAKVVERPTDASETIRRVLLTIPDGYIYVAVDIDNQIEVQRTKWMKRQKDRRTEHNAQVAQGRVEHAKEMAAFKAEDAERRKREKIERRLEKITSSARWTKLVTNPVALPEQPLPATPLERTFDGHLKVLVVGYGRRVDLPNSAAQFVADNLGPHCTLIAGTPRGNPGAVLTATFTTNNAVSRHAVRLYQPSYDDQASDFFGGVAVTFVNEKDGMRRKMVADSDVVLVLGGEEGTLHEVLLALEAGKPTVVIKGYGPVATYVLSTKSLRQASSLKPCKNIVEAVQTVLNMP